VGGLGPTAGQNHHCGVYAPEKIPYAIERYVKETNRLYGGLDRRLEGRRFILGSEYSIADIASYPWIVPWEALQQDLGAFPNIKRWLDEIAARPATVRAYAKGEPYARKRPMSEEEKKVWLGQTADSVREQRGKSGAQ
jgi:GST-like protein